MQNRNDPSERQSLRKSSREKVAAEVKQGTKPQNIAGAKEK
jgi:hypothetical protein